MLFSYALPRNPHRGICRQNGLSRNIRRFDSAFFTAERVDNKAKGQKSDNQYPFVLPGDGPLPRPEAAYPNADKASREYFFQDMVGVFLYNNLHTKRGQEFPGHAVFRGALIGYI